MSNADNWTDMDGVVAKRSNRVVTGVLEWAAKSDVNKVKRRNIEGATKHLLPVEGEDTVTKYVERVVDAGPFSPARAPGQWWIDWSRVPEDEFSSEVPSNE